MTIAEWKDIDEQPVPGWGTYLVCDCTDSDSVDLAVWDLDDTWAFEDGSDFANGDCTVTHWAELPEQPPLVEKEDGDALFTSVDPPDSREIVTQLVDISTDLMRDAYDLESSKDLLDSAWGAVQLLQKLLRSHCASLPSLCGIKNPKMGEG